MEEWSPNLLHPVMQEALTLVLLGGLKNAQKKDVGKARKILAREISGKSL